MVDVSVIIPVFRDNERLNQCIRALDQQSWPKEMFEVLVVNNDPETDVVIEQSHSLQLRICLEKKPGSYAARNYGIRQASGSILAFTDSDCIPDQEWISNAVHHFNRLPDLDRIAGRIQLFRQQATISEALYEYQKQYSFDQVTNVEQHQFSVTANLFARKRVFEQAGFFDDTLYSGGDYEWGRRAHKTGASMIYDPSVMVMHPVRPTLWDLIRKKRRTKGGAYDLAPPKRSWMYSIKYFLTHLIPPTRQIRKINPELPLFLKVRIAGILWALRLTGLYEWIRLQAMNVERLKQ